MRLTAALLVPPIRLSYVTYVDFDLSGDTNATPTPSPAEPRSAGLTTGAVHGPPKMPRTQTTEFFRKDYRVSRILS